MKGVVRWWLLTAFVRVYHPTVPQFCYFSPLTIEDIVPRMHLTKQCHVWDWVAAGRGGANAGL